MADGNTDDYAPIQEAIDSACAQSPAGMQGGVVYLPPGSYLVSQPLFLHCSGLTFEGAGELTTGIAATYAGGPTIVQGPSSADPLPMAAALLSGNGGALSFADPTLSGTGYVLDLRAAPTMDLNGLSQFTAETTFKITSNTGDTVTFMGSSDYSGNHKALELLLYEQNNTVEADLTVGGTRHSLVSGAVTVGSSTHHIAVSYDGSTIRLFYDGAVVASQSASGSVTQEPQEGMALGGEPRGAFWDGAWRTDNGGFVVDGVRISKSARYTGNFSRPTAKFSNDGNTLLLLNFDNNPSFFTIAQSNMGNVWMPRMDTHYPNIVNYITISNLQIWGGRGGGAPNGILAVGCIQCSVDYVSIFWTRIGLQFYNNSYRSEVTKPQVTEGEHGWINFLESVDSGPVDLTNAHFDGGLISYYSSGGGINEGVYVSPATSGIYPFYIVRGSTETDFTFTQATVDFEPFGNSPMRTAVYLDGPVKATFIGGVFEDYNSSPVVQVDGGGNITFIGSEFNTDGAASASAGATASPPEIVEILSPPSSPVQLDNVQIITPSGVPLTNDPSSVLVE